jgi:hypothetical protein
MHLGIVNRSGGAFGRRRRGAVILAAAVSGLLLLMIPVHPAAAALPGPSTLNEGFIDLPMLESSSSALRTRWLGAARTTGASIVRLDVDWAGIAPVHLSRAFHPADPASRSYYWDILDGAVRTASADGLQVLLTFYNTPSWAEGPGRPRNAWFGSWRPNVHALATFARVVARRYDGRFPDPLQPGRFLPNVTLFQAWNEPNLPNYLSPQWVRGRHGGWIAESPLLYRPMLNAVYTTIKATRPDATVLSAGTSPYGSLPSSSNVSSMAPVLFLRELLCLHTTALHPEPCPHPAHFDGFDTHPYSALPTSHASAADDVSVPDLGKLQRVVHAALSSGRLLPAGPKPLWVTEIGWGTKPPNPNGISQSLQARYLELAFYEIWRQGVSHVLWFTLRDSGTSSQFFGGGGGVFFADGQAKLATTAFSFPFVAVRGGGSGATLTLWGHAPQAGSVIIQQRAGGGWANLTQLQTTAGGIFYARHPLSGHPGLRAVQGAAVSPVWSTGP